MDREVMARLRHAVAAAEDKKAYHLLALDISARTSIADAFVICSAGSSRQSQAIADAVQRDLRDLGARPLAVEGHGQGSWILMDYGDFVLHVFLEETRSFYGLERLWGDAPDITAELRADPS